MNLSNDSNNQNIKIDIVNFERKQRQLMNELAMRRTQVEELKSELDAVNLKNHQLKRDLEASESASKEHQYNLNLALKNSRFLDDQLQIKRESVIKFRLQHDSVATEKKHLRELLEKSEMEKYDLTREVNELKTQYQYNLAYQQELLDHDTKTRAEIAHLTEMTQKFHIGQEEVMQLSERIKNYEGLHKAGEFYRNQYYKCKKEFADLENKLIIANAAVEKFELLTSSHQLTQQDETEIIIQQWERATNRFNEQTECQQKLINNLTVALKSEQETNTKLCIQEEALEKKYEDLLKESEDVKNKLNLITSKQFADKEMQTENEVDLAIKTEIIEIDSI